MGRFFSKYRNLFLLLLMLAPAKSIAQVLDNTSINLNAGGYVNDVIYDPYHDCYIVVGKFTQVNGVHRVNMAFLDRATLAVETLPYLVPIDSTNGEIRSVALTRTLSGSLYTYHLFIGGNFGSVKIAGTNHARKGIVKLTATQSTLLPFTHTPFSLAAWNADVDMTPLLTGVYAEGIDDILISNDTLIFSGRFWGVNSTSLYQTRDGIAAFTLSGTVLAYPSIALAGTYSSRFYCIRKKGVNLFMGGYISGGGLTNGRLFKLDAAGASMSAFNYNYTSLRAVYGMEFQEDSLLYVVDDRASENSGPDGFYVVRQSNGTHKNNHSLSPAGTGMIGNAASGVSSMTLHDDEVFVTTTQASKYLVAAESQSEGPYVTTLDWNANAPGALTNTINGNVHVAGNKLFVSAANISTLSGQSRVGLGAYCLQPDNPQNFTVFDTTICPEDVVSYAIPTVPFADGYKWEFTGTGAFLVGSGSLDLPIELSFTSANSKQVSFAANFSPGQLKITPYSLCNGSTKLYSNTVSINIHSNPLPHVNAGVDTTLTCVRDSVILYGYSDSAVVSYEWVYPFFGDNVAGQIDTVSSAGNYVFKVKNALGCPNFDTVNVSLDTLKPAVTLPIGTYDLTCAVPEKTFAGSSSTPNTTGQWFEPIDSAFLSNPITVNLPGAYYFVVTDTMNGCEKSEGILVFNNHIIPTIAVVGYPVLTSVSALDTLTCSQDTLTLTTYSSTLGSTVEWMEQDTSAFFGNTLEITDGGFYYLFATEPTTGCTNSTGVFILEFQNSLDAQTVETGLLNCSSDSLILNGTSLSAGAVFEWNGTGLSGASNPVAVYDPGTYYFTATDPLTGCTGTDSVSVVRDYSITLSAGEDRLICEGEIVPVQVNYQGTISGINYLWSNGETSQHASYTAGLQPYAVVEVSGDNGCYGTDTIYLNLPPVPVINFEGFKPCDDGASGSIVANPVSGMAPFTFSIDNGINFQGTSVFSGLNIGTYPVLVKDSLGCTYNFTATIDENSNLPSPQFIFSTYNFATDTVVMIDVSNPPTDSTFWVFPPELIVLDYNPVSPMILLPDTGVFEITMNAWYGNCLVKLSKLIYASPFDSLNATSFNANGIKTVLLYPNPNSGNFMVSVEFYKAQRASLVIQDMIGTTYFFNEFDESLQLTETISLDQTVIDGTYVVKIISEFDSAFITFILAR